MVEIITKTRKWGNSLRIVLPRKTIIDENIKENQELKILIVKDSDVLKETFGMFKGKLKQSSQEMKDEFREILYD